MTSLLERIANPESGTDTRILAARHSFWVFCKLLYPKFFKDDRPYLKELCDVLQGIYEHTLINPQTQEPYRKLMLNVPPRHGKSFTISLFNRWIMGQDPVNTRVISLSYNDTLAGRFGKQVRDGISETKADPNIVIYSDIFPGTRIKDGDGAAQLWALEGSYFSFLSAGFGGTITGVGCSVGIIDDPIKNHVEAYNDRLLEDQYRFYGDTFLSRVEEDGIQIIIMTRWSSKDLCGRILASEDGPEWYEFRRAAVVDEASHTMLCSQLLSWDRYQRILRSTSPDIVQANYNNQPIDVKGKLYPHFATYAPGQAPKPERIVAYVDTADTGSDSLMCAIAGQYQGEGYMRDVYFTAAPMEVTEAETARRLHENAVDYCLIESNNGGRGFARNVERILWERYRNRHCTIKWFHQNENKQARILAGSSYVMNHLYMPDDWMVRWKDYYTAMTGYKATGGNAHDDAPDGTTGLAELIQGKGGRRDPIIY